MTTTTLTAKQQQVLDLIREGRSIGEIAKRMHIKPTGVYGHMSKMRKAGIDLSVGEQQNGAQAESTRTEASELDIPSIIRTQLGEAERSLAELDAEIKAMADRLDDIKAKRQARTDEIARHQNALNAYQA